MAKEKPKKEYSNEWVKCDFSEEEIKEMAHKMAGDVQQIQDAESELAKIKADLMGRIKRLNQVVVDVSLKVRDGFEYRNVKVRVIKDWKMKTVNFFLEDEDGRATGKAVKTRTMNPSEYQMTIDDVQKSGD